MNVSNHLNENGKVIAESVNGFVTAQIIWADRPLARKIGPNWYYYIFNAHGDVVALMDESGSFVNTYSYDAWGNITSQTETIDNPIKYAGEYLDNETGLYYLRNRYYDPTIGRFTQEDPTRDGDNWYIYCGDNPVRFTDSTGLSATAVMVGGVSIALSSPAGQQLMAKAFELAIPVGQFVAQYGEKALQIAWTYGGTIIDSAGNAIQYAADKTGEAFNKAKNWAKEKISNSSNGDPNKDPNRFNQGMNNVCVLQNTKIKGYQVSMDLERGGSGLTNIHVKIDNVKYFYNESVQAFTNSAGQRLPKSLRGNQQIINAFGKAKNLLNQGW